MRQLKILGLKNVRPWGSKWSANTTMRQATTFGVSLSRQMLSVPSSEKNFTLRPMLLNLPNTRRPVRRYQRWTNTLQTHVQNALQHICTQNLLYARCLTQLTFPPEYVQ